LLLGVRSLIAVAADARQIITPIPGVDILTTNETPTPNSRVVHLLDYHYVPARDFVGENDPEADALLYREFLLKVQLLQAEQLAILECLSKHHGLAEAWAARWTE
jgi:hypothetical protein